MWFYFAITRLNTTDNSDFNGESFFILNIWTKTAFISRTLLITWEKLEDTKETDKE